MERNPIHLPADQWNFLSVLQAFKEPTPLPIIQSLAGLSDSHLGDCLKSTAKLNLIDQSEGNRITLQKKIPESIQKRLGLINNKKKFNALLDRIDALKLKNEIGPNILSYLMMGAGRNRQAGFLKIKTAHKAVDEGLIDDGYHLLAEGLPLLTPCLQHDRYAVNGLLIPSVLLFSDLCFYLGKGFDEAYQYLEKALEVSKYLGDRRSQAMIELHIGRLFYFGNRRLEAMEHFASGQEIVESLADEDIWTQSYEFIGLYYFMRGLHKEAVEYLDKAIRTYENNAGVRLIVPVALFLFGYSTAYLGEFHRAIGILDYFWRRAVSEKNIGPACLYRAVLGTVLLMMGKKQEAFWHFEGTLRDAINSQNALAQYMTYGALAYYNYLNKDYKEAREILAHTFSEGARSGIRQQFASPYILELIYEFGILGFDPIPGYSFREQSEKIMREPSVHLRGVALRLKAQEASLYGENIEIIESTLNDSLHYLQLSGDPIQLAKTKTEMAKLRLKEGNEREARKLSQEARKGLSGISDDLFPSGMRFLLEETNSQRKTQDIYLESLLSQIDMIIKSPISPVFDETLDSLVSHLTRILGAERCGLFWLSKGKSKDADLRASRNLHKNEITSPNFNSGLKLIMKTFRTGQPQKEKSEYPNFNLTSRIACHMLCLPLKIEAKVQGVLYFDNSYLVDCFDSLNEKLLTLLSDKLSLWVEQVENVSKLMEQKIRVTKEESVQRELSGGTEFIIRKSQVMAKTMEKVDRVARTDSPVLVEGETGVGKELIARRIHDRSSRATKPLVILDMTTIPENLIESELFGYEKGAFTGANTRKIGRVEQAHEGTLFIDEIGEVPKSLQVKLLRVLQERTFTRIGGVCQLESDFRLVAATNRNLREEVAAGRFREDLYYRLNTINISLPSLRECPEDIILLAHAFLSRFAKRYNRSSLKLSRGDEEKLLHYNWPGNVRELKNIIEGTAILSNGDHLELTLPTSSKSPAISLFSSQPTLDDLQRRYISHVLDQTGGRIAGPQGAAKILGMRRTSLNTRMKKLGINRMKG
ncbi:MAG: sigma 54-interacting transcriptional regulator [Deltaproteobacteria bacterium]|nr:sigma 54-interacting transcriptional regulator [Deltaproteobacteria bacterium]